MAETKKYYHNIDLIKNKVTNLLLNPLTSTERNALTSSLTTSDEGYTTYDTTLNQQFFWDGTTWITSGGDGGGGAVNAVTAAVPITSSGGSYPEISTSVSGTKLIGRYSSTTGVMQEIALGTGLSFSGNILNASAAVTPAGLTKTDDTNVTITLSGTPGTALLQSVNIALGWTGTLADSRIASANTWNNKESAITAGTTTQYWRGDKSWQTLNTAAVPESGNLYYTDVRARAAHSFTAGSGAYNSTTGVITIPTAISQIGGGTWGSLNYPTWASGTPFVKMTAAGIFSLDNNTYLTTAVTSLSATGLLTATPSTGSVTISTSINTNKLIGRYGANTGVMQEITIGSGLSLSTGGTLTATGGTSGPTGFEQHFLLMGA
jgi:hypothetical protein